MFNKKTILQILQLVSKHRQGFYDKRTTHPAREWMFGLLAFVTIIILGSLQSAHVFVSYQNISTEGGVFQEQVVAYSRPIAEKAFSIYSKRKDAYLLLQNSIVPTAEIITDTITSSSTPEVESSSVEATTTEENTSGSVEMAN